MRTREEHLSWAKQRALEYLDRGDNVEAWTSMCSDLGKHQELKNHPGIKIGTGFLMLKGWIENTPEVRRWIEGFR